MPTPIRTEAGATLKTPLCLDFSVRFARNLRPDSVEKTLCPQTNLQVSNPTAPSSCATRSAAISGRLAALAAISTKIRHQASRASTDRDDGACCAREAGAALLGPCRAAGNEIADRRARPKPRTPKRPSQTLLQQRPRLWRWWRGPTFSLMCAACREGFIQLLSIGVGPGPQISIQKGPPRLTFRTVSVRPVGAGRDCGDGASAG
jgi:hypothetical protein